MTSVTAGQQQIQQNEVGGRVNRRPRLFDGSGHDKLSLILVERLVDDHPDERIVVDNHDPLHGVAGVHNVLQDRKKVSTKVLTVEHTGDDVAISTNDAGTVSIGEPAWVGVD